MAFEVAWKNPLPPNKSDGRDLVKCCVCDKSGVPLGDWGCYEITVGWGYYGYDYCFWVCSEECDNNREPIIKALRKKLNEEHAAKHDLTIPDWLKKILNEE